MCPINPDNLLSNYDFELPDEAVAQAPACERAASRLMVVDKTGSDQAACFADLSDYLPEGALLVANNSRVVPARLFGAKPTGGRVEVLLLTPLPLLRPRPDARPGWHCAEATALVRASKGVKSGQAIRFEAQLEARVLSRGEFGRCRVELSWCGELGALLEEVGHIPLPPYIRRPDGEADKLRYQTVYSNPEKAGSVAAPTAGLHFTPELTRTLAAKGFQWAEVTLYVGYGTFSPVRCEDIRDHRMHAEYVEMSEATARAVARAKSEGRKVVAVGTTSVRTLEGAFAATGGIAPFAGETDIFISPGYEFKVVDQMITNFHLPLSSLIIMVAAFAGRERILRAYRKALDLGFRFFSYGDAMLIR